MSVARNGGQGETRRRRAVTSALGGLVLTLGLVGCDSDNGDDSATSPTPGLTRAPDTASFSGTPPSALASKASSAVDSARASASAAASSASARASAFEASVSAETARRSAAAEKELKNVEGRGNALSEVGMTGLPTAETGGLLAVVVTITNKTQGEASYAVRVDFKDSSGNVVESRFVGAENLEPGQREQAFAISRRPLDAKLTPYLAKAQRY
ncbi:hypothetical protein ABZZ79_07870 [Streptomyces sp. NPDC006458]|uniref:hypothetical protein n=1 Tax=Streptomyces sp. NPDC006458 TaxID=3154302 RepID=UPI0033B84140